MISDASSKSRGSNSFSRHVICPDSARGSKDSSRVGLTTTILALAGSSDATFCVATCPPPTITTVLYSILM